MEEVSSPRRQSPGRVQLHRSSSLHMEAVIQVAEGSGSHALIIP
jgi:hypothetical protein